MTDTVAEERLAFFTKAASDRYKWAKKVDPMAVRAFNVRAENLRQERLDRLSQLGGNHGSSEEIGGIVLSAS